MNHDERRRRGKAICASLVEDVGKVATPGLSRWPGAMDIVGPAEADFLAALLQWEETGSAHLIDRVRKAYDRLVGAWKDAANLFDTRRRVS